MTPTLVIRDTPVRPPALAAAILGALVTVAVFSPGFVSPDSLELLSEARSGIFRDYQPPLLAWIWSFTDRVVSGPLGMLILVNFVFWFGTAVFFDTVLARAGQAAAAVLLLGFLPPVFGLLSTIWKDVFMGACLVASFACLARAGKSVRPRRWAVPAILLLFLAAASRHNGIAAVLPAALWANGIPGVAPGFAGSSRCRRIAGGFVLVFLIGIGVRSFDAAVTTGPSEHTGQVLFVHDLVVLTVETGEDLVPEPFRPKPAMTPGEWRTLYSPWNVEPTYTAGGGLSVPELHDPEAVRILGRAWLRAVLRHPATWLRHRARLFSMQWGFGSKVWYPFQAGIAENDLGISTDLAPRAEAAVRILGHFADSILFRGWFYLLLGVIGLAIACARGIERHAMEVALASSGLLYGLAYFLVSSTPDFRLIWWTVVSALLLVPPTLLPRRS